MGFVLISLSADASTYFPGDLWVSRHLQQIHSSVFDKAVTLPETFADLPLVLAIWVPSVVLLWLLRYRLEAGLLAAAPFGWVVNRIVKELVMRPRPSHELVRIQDAANDPSFPSGHVITAVLILGFLLYIVTILTKQPLVRLILQLACLYGIIFCGIARIYHGAHWFSDVYGAALLGALILAVIIAIHRWLLAKLDMPVR